MENISNSASKLVLLSLILVLNLIVLIVVAVSVWKGQFGDMEKLILAMFSNSLAFVLGYYFNGKGTQELKESVEAEVKAKAEQAAKG